MLIHMSAHNPGPLLHLYQHKSGSRVVIEATISTQMVDQIQVLIYQRTESYKISASCLSHYFLFVLHVLPILVVDSYCIIYSSLFMILQCRSLRPRELYIIMVDRNAIKTRLNGKYKKYTKKSQYTIEVKHYSYVTAFHNLDYHVDTQMVMLLFHNAQFFLLRIRN